MLTIRGRFSSLEIDFEGAVTGFGMWAVPVQGSHVALYFENNDIRQPRYFGSMPGFPLAIPDKTKGFSDPNGQYPTTRLGEPDYHRLARGISENTGVSRKNELRKLGVATAGGPSWSEPQSPYNAQYPHNFVMAFHGGLIMEFDSTPNNTRINIHHLQSNSYIEISQTGQMVIRNTGDRYDVTKGGNRNEYAEINFNITATGKVNIKCEDDANIQTSGDANITATGDVNVQGANINLN